MRKLYSVGGSVFILVLTALVAEAGGPDISAQRLLSSWQEGDPRTKMLAEVIASAFASGFSWGGDVAGKRAYCAAPEIRGHEIMTAFEGFLSDHPRMASEPYGAAMAATLRQAFPCTDQR
jgi:Rap1a immunity proteins